MANINEQAQWADNVYLIDENDPVVGGPDGIDNIPHQQLTNRTAWLKEQTEQLAQDVNAVGVDGQNALWSGIERALSEIGLLAAEMHRQQTVRHQEGTLRIYNRGIKSGCSLSKSTNASRNLSVSGGQIFLRGQIMPVAAQENATAVPPNTSGATATVQVYAIVASGQVLLACTGLNQLAPADALVLAELAVPDGSTSATDPDLSNVNITTTARIEPDWPDVQISPAYIDRDFARVMGKSGYELTLDVTDFAGGQRPQLVAPAGGRADNTFRVYLHGAADDVDARFVAHLMNQ